MTGTNTRGDRNTLRIAIPGPVRHDARWGMATLEVVLAIAHSSEGRREIMLSHQCPAY